MKRDVDVVRQIARAPGVNLLPAAVAERRLLRRQRAGFGAALAILLALLALFYLYEADKADKARQAASREQAVTLGLQAQKARLQPFADLQAEVTALERLQASVYAREIRFSGIMQDVSTLVPDNAWLTRLSVAVKDTGTSGAAGAAAGTQGAAAATPPPGAPGSGSPVASITFTGMALGHVDVGAFVRTLDGTIKRRGQQVYLNPFFTSSQLQEGTDQQQATVTFSATVDVGAAAFSGRFQRPVQTGGR